jgi:predicted phosphodiesterase
MKMPKLTRLIRSKLILTILSAGLMALLFVSLFGKMLFPIKAFDFLVSVQLAPEGSTELKIPPVGVITAKTHATPVKIRITLENFNFNYLYELITEEEITNTSSEELVNVIQSELHRNTVRYLFRLLGLALAGGLVGAMLVNGKKPGAILTGALTALTLMLLVTGITYYTYDSRQFHNPEYRGALKSAPWMMGMAENLLEKYNLLGEQLEIVAGNLYQLYEGIAPQELSAELNDENDISVLLVSDIHNNVAANRFLKQISESFAIDLFIDTGDLTDYGTSLESLLMREIKEIRQPYLFVPGNHDSPEVVEKLSAFPRVRVADDQMVEIAALKILALKDPLTESKEISFSSQKDLSAYRQKNLQLWKEASPPPDLVAVHNLQYATPLIGKAPLIVHGHTHQAGIVEQKGTVIINAGSTGGAGLRGLQAVKEIPYSVVLMRFRKKETGSISLYAADVIKVYNLERGFSLERKYFQEKESQHEGV